MRSGFFSSDANVAPLAPAGCAFSLTGAYLFLYNSGFSAFMPTEKEQGEPAPRLEAHIRQAGRTHRAKHFFWIDHEDVFRKSP
ncbi:hypothetical protein [Burkholderia guangdongensis]|uniref:hypothetical protein n=1 Tax=Burkholderia guangdongensis TaxID=1792500 RepID=UPI0015CBAE88|nr:hypothetical protein [Burkholderia guangdongensis]